LAKAKNAAERENEAETPPGFRQEGMPSNELLSYIFSLCARKNRWKWGVFHDLVRFTADIVLPVQAARKRKHENKKIILYFSAMK